MRMNELPPKSEAVRRLRVLPKLIRKERLRCAQAALDTAMFAHDKYPDEPAQWIRAEAILRDVLMDQSARIEWFIACRKPRAPSSSSPAKGGKP